jgi:hypothetical protein
MKFEWTFFGIACLILLICAVYDLRKQSPSGWVWKDSKPKQQPQIRQKLTPKYRSSVTPADGEYFAPWFEYPDKPPRMMKQEPPMHRVPKYDGWWSAKDDREL